MATAAVAACLVGAPGVTSAADGSSAPTCRGVAATVVGTSGQVAIGTRRRDVIVTGGANRVVAGAGDDLVCVTGSARQVSVGGGAGDDRVLVDTDRSEVAFYAGSGSDTFVGNARSDSVGVNADGRDLIRTKGGRDEVAVLVTPWARHLSVNTGARTDSLSLKTQIGSTRSDYPDSVTADLALRSLVVTSATTGRSLAFDARRFENLEVNNFRTASLRGDDGDNELATLDGCQVSLVGLGGDDVLHAGVTDTPTACTPPADSTADGGDGTDQCFATRLLRCEEILPS